MKIIIITLFLMQLPVLATPFKVVLVPHNSMAGLGEIGQVDSLIGATEYGVLYDYDKAKNETLNFLERRVLPHINFDNSTLAEVLGFIEDFINNRRGNIKEKRPIYFFKCENELLASKIITVEMQHATVKEVIDKILDQVEGHMAVTPFMIFVNIKDNICCAPN